MAIPEGSSSAAPVITPGPINLKMDLMESLVDGKTYLSIIIVIAYFLNYITDWSTSIKYIFRDVLFLTCCIIYNKQ